MKNKRVNLSNKIYPLFYGLSSDLMFWIAINTLFLATVKHLNAAEISFLTSFGSFVALILQFFSYKIIEKMGDLKSVRFGVFCLLISALLLTFSNHYFLLMLGEMFYEMAFVFKCVDTVILKKNLEYLNREDEFITITSKTSIIYAFVTMLIALVSGILFDVNPYIPMYLCIGVCILNVFLSTMIYEVDKSKKGSKKLKKVNFGKTALLIIVCFGLIYSCIDLGQSNSKLFIQYSLDKFLPISEVAIWFSIVIFISRIVRFLSDILFLKIYNKIKDEIIFLIYILLVSSFLCLIFGSFVQNNYVSICIMSIGFFLFLAIRDPLDNYMKKILLENCSGANEEQGIICLMLSRKIFKFICSFIVTGILWKLDMLFVMLFLIILSCLYIFVIGRLYEIIKNN